MVTTILVESVLAALVFGIGWFSHAFAVRGETERLQRAERTLARVIKGELS